MVDKKNNKVTKPPLATKVVKSAQPNKSKSSKNNKNVMIFKPGRYNSKKLNNYRDFLKYILAGDDDEGELEEV